MSDDELFTRLLYFSLAHLHLTQEEFWLMPTGLILDLIECHLQYHGIKKPKKTYYIDEIIPDGIL